MSLCFFKKNKCTFCNKNLYKTADIYYYCFSCNTNVTISNNELLKITYFTSKSEYSYYVKEKYLVVNYTTLHYHNMSYKKIHYDTIPSLSKIKDIDEKNIKYTAIL